MNPAESIVNQYCFVVYVGSNNIAGTKKGKFVSHRSTIYPCYLPVLGDSTGAGRINLPSAKIQFFLIYQHLVHYFL